MRRPLRKQGIRRHGALLDATAKVLVAQPGDAPSLATIAAEAGVPLPSVYHFFPNRTAILVALAGRYHAQLAERARVPLDPPPQRWQDIVRRRQHSGAAYLNANPAALRLFMGAGVSAAVRTLDLEGNASLARLRAEEFRHWFDCAGLTDLEHWLAVSIGVMDGIWAVSWSRHGQITERYLSESVTAACAYLRSYLPEMLPRRGT